MSRQLALVHISAWGLLIAFFGSVALPSASALDVTRTLTQNQHRIWQVQQGLPQANINAICQTQDGYLWLGTHTGLVRFDGIRFTAMTVFDGVTLPPMEVDCLLEDAAHRLWIGTSGEGLLLLDRGAIRAFHIADGLPSDTIQHLTVDHLGQVWIGTPAGLAKWADDRFTTVAVSPTAVPANCSAVCESGDGTIWTGTDGPRLSACKGSAVTQTLLTSVSPYARVLSLLPGDDNAVWVGTNEGLVRLKNGAEERFTTANGLADNTIFCLSQGKDGVIWVGTKDGYSRLRNGVFESFRASDGLSQSTVYSLLEDREGSLWVGTKHGLNQFVDRRTIPFTTSEGLPSNNTGPILQDTGGTVWVGTLDAGLSRYDGHHFSVLTTADGLPSNSIFALADDSAGNVWVGTDKGLCHLQQGKVDRTYRMADGLPSDKIRCLLRDRDGALWAGTSAGPATLRGERFESPAGAAALNHAAVLAITQLGGDLLFATTDGSGIYAYGNGAIRPFLPNQPPLRDVDAFFVDADGALWMGLFGGGLRLVDGDRVVSFTSHDGLFDDDIFDIISDNQDRLWMACSNGIFSVSRADLHKFAAGQIARFTTTPFSPLDALRTLECQPGVQPGAARINDGRLWFSTIRGVIGIDPNRMQRTLPLPPAVMEEVVIDGRSQPPGKIQQLSPGYKNVEFRYTGLGFQTPGRTEFRYKLVGFDKDWTAAGTRRQAFYTNLPPGQFQFWLAAGNGDGVFGDPVSAASFIVPPHFYQETWFIPVCVIAIVISGWVVYRRRIARVRSQLQLVLDERTRIARELHDTLLQGFSGVTMEMQALAVRLAPSDERSTLDEIILDAGHCMREARQSVAGLRAGRGMDPGLAAAISLAAEQMVVGKDIRLKLKVQKNLPPLPAEVEYNLLRIALEAVANAIRHSGSRWIELALSSSPHDLTLAVKDDGRGFSQSARAAAEPHHYGVVGMQERAKQMGADLSIESAAGRGTVVSLSLAIRGSENGKSN